MNTVIRTIRNLFILAGFGDEQLTQEIESIKNRYFQ